MTDKAVSYVYLLCRHDGRPCYVGKGSGDRWLYHEELTLYKKSGHYNKHLGSIIRQAHDAGMELPKIKLVENVTDEQAFEIEKLYIAAIGRELNGGPLVNLIDGGDGPAGYKPSAKLLAYLSSIRKGRKLSEEWRKNIGSGLKGVPKTEEHKKALSAALTGTKKKSGWWSTEEGRAKQRANNRGNTGRKHSVESINLISQAAIRQYNSRQLPKSEETSS